MDTYSLYATSQDPDTATQVREFSEDHDVDEDMAERALEIMEEEGLDEDEALELAEEM